jgi:hypothetical protein
MLHRIAAARLMQLNGPIHGGAVHELVPVIVR